MGRDDLRGTHQPVEAGEVFRGVRPELADSHLFATRPERHSFLERQDLGIGCHVVIFPRRSDKRYSQRMKPAVVLLAVLVLAGCSARPLAVADPTPTPEISLSTPTPTPTKDGPADQEFTDSIETLWGDCLAPLGVGQLVFYPNAEGKSPVGQVTGVDGAGVTLVWNMAVGNTGDILNMPADQVTLDELATVGC